MTSINLLYDLANYTPGDAAPVQSNFQQIESHINTELIERDGSVAMRAALRLANSAPVNDLDAASKGYVNSVSNARAAYRMVAGAGQSLPTATDIVISWQNTIDTVQFGGSWWTVANPTTLTVPAGCDGIYYLQGEVLNTGSVPQMNMRPWINGAVYTRYLDVNGWVALVPGDTIQWKCDNGGAADSVLSAKAMMLRLSR